MKLIQIIIFLVSVGLNSLLFTIYWVHLAIKLDYLNNTSDNLNNRQLFKSKVKRAHIIWIITFFLGLVINFLLEVF